VIDEVSDVNARKPLNHHPNNSAAWLKDLERNAADDSIELNALSDPVTQYFKKIGRFALLTRADERELARQIDAAEQEILRFCECGLESVRRRITPWMKSAVCLI